MLTVAARYRARSSRRRAKRSAAPPSRRTKFLLVADAEGRAVFREREKKVAPWTPLEEVEAQGAERRLVASGTHVAFDAEVEEGRQIVVALQHYLKSATSISSQSSTAKASRRGSPSTIRRPPCRAQRVLRAPRVSSLPAQTQFVTADAALRCFGTRNNDAARRRDAPPRRSWFFRASSHVTTKSSAKERARAIAISRPIFATALVALESGEARAPDEDARMMLACRPTTKTRELRRRLARPPRSPPAMRSGRRALLSEDAGAVGARVRSMLAHEGVATLDGRVVARESPGIKFRIRGFTRNPTSPASSR